MAKLKFHFFHGFLGSPADWDGVAHSLYRAGIDDVVCHDLVKDFLQLNKEENSFVSWAEQKSAELRQSPDPKILVGYSLGGRLLMHLPPEDFHHMILLGAHPGLSMGERDKRKASDEIWLQKLENLSWQDWLAQWNAQDVFAEDRVRPARDSIEVGTVGSMLWRWSLGRQDPRDEHLQWEAEQVHWGCGSRDKKFLGLIPRMSSILSEQNIFTIENAGHGVLFDQPEALANKIMRIVANVE